MKRLCALISLTLILFLIFLLSYVVLAETMLNLPIGVTVIDEEAFAGNTALREVILPEGIERIERRAFADSGVTTINLPSSLFYIAEDAFDGTPLADVTVSKGCYAYDWAARHGFIESEWDASPVEDFTFNTLSDTTCEVKKYIGSDTDIVIPQKDADGKTVIQIGSSAFSDQKSLTSIDIPLTVNSIQAYAFRNCISLTNITIPNGVTQLGSYVFSGCTGLTSIVLPDSVNSLYDSTFTNCAQLQSIDVSAGNTVFSSIDGMLANKNATVLIRCPQGKVGSVVIPDGIVGIYNYAFYGCTGLTGIDIPDSVTGIGNNAFNGCTELTDISIPDTVTTIGNYAFAGCTSLTGITIPSNLTTISQGAFSGCLGLTGAITIPEGVTRINSYAFNGCSGLSSITIPESVQYISTSAFTNTSDQLQFSYVSGSYAESWLITNEYIRKAPEIANMEFTATEIHYTDGDQHSFLALTGSYNMRANSKAYIECHCYISDTPDFEDAEEYGGLYGYLESPLIFTDYPIKTELHWGGAEYADIWYVWIQAQNDYGTTMVGPFAAEKTDAYTSMYVTLTGFVTTKDGTPIPGVRVYYAFDEAISTYTDEEGRWTFKHWDRRPEGQIIHFSHPDYHFELESFECEYFSTTEEHPTVIGYPVELTGSFDDDYVELEPGEIMQVAGSVTSGGSYYNYLGRVSLTIDGYHVENDDSDRYATQDFQYNNLREISLADYDVFKLDTTREPLNVPGTYTVKLWAATAGDNNGRMLDGMTVIVRPDSPDANISFTMTPNPVMVGGVVTFDVSSNYELVQLMVDGIPYDQLEIGLDGTGTLHRRITSIGNDHSRHVAFRGYANGEWSVPCEMQFLTVNELFTLVPPTLSGENNIRTEDSYELTWTSVDNADGYVLYVRTPNGVLYGDGIKLNDLQTSFFFPAGTFTEPGQYRFILMAWAEGATQVQGDKTITVEPTGEPTDIFLTESIWNAESTNASLTLKVLADSGWRVATKPTWMNYYVPGGYQESMGGGGSDDEEGYDSESDAVNELYAAGDVHLHLQDNTEDYRRSGSFVVTDGENYAELEIHQESAVNEALQVRFTYPNEAASTRRTGEMQDVSLIVNQDFLNGRLEITDPDGEMETAYFSDRQFNYSFRLTKEGNYGMAAIVTKSDGTTAQTELYTISSSQDNNSEYIFDELPMDGVIEALKCYRNPRLSAWQIGGTDVLVGGETYYRYAVGYGHVLDGAYPSGYNFSITEEQAEAYLRQDFYDLVEKVYHVLSARGVYVSSSQACAIAMLCYDVGFDTVLNGSKLAFALYKYGSHASDIPSWKIYNGFIRFHEENGYDSEALFQRRMNEAHFSIQGYYETKTWDSAELAGTWFHDGCLCAYPVPDNWYSDIEQASSFTKVEYYELGRFAQRASIDIYDSVIWEAEGDCTWLRVETDAAGYGNDRLTFSVTTNTENYVRMGTITLTDVRTGEKKQVYVIQEASDGSMNYASIQVNNETAYLGETVEFSIYCALSKNAWLQETSLKKLDKATGMYANFIPDDDKFNVTTTSNGTGTIITVRFNPAEEGNYYLNTTVCCNGHSSIALTSKTVTVAKGIIRFLTNDNPDRYLQQGGFYKDPNKLPPLEWEQVSGVDHYILRVVDLNSISANDANGSETGHYLTIDDKTSILISGSQTRCNFYNGSMPFFLNNHTYRVFLGAYDVEDRELSTGLMVFTICSDLFDIDVKINGKTGSDLSFVDNDILTVSWSLSEKAVMENAFNRSVTNYKIRCAGKSKINGQVFWLPLLENDYQLYQGNSLTINSDLRPNSDYTLYVAGMTDEGAKIAIGQIDFTVTESGTKPHVNPRQLEVETACTVIVGQTHQISACVLPLDADDRELEWSVSDPTIASVKDGKVTGLKPGQTTVDVSIEEHGSINASVVVTVIKAADVGKVPSISVQINGKKTNKSFSFTDAKEEAYGYANRLGVEGRIKNDEQDSLSMDVKVKNADQIEFSVLNINKKPSAILLPSRIFEPGTESTVNPVSSFTVQMPNTDEETTVNFETYMARCAIPGLYVMTVKANNAKESFEVKFTFSVRHCETIKASGEMQRALEEIKRKTCEVDGVHTYWNMAEGWNFIKIGEVYPDRHFMTKISHKACTTHGLSDKNPQEDWYIWWYYEGDSPDAMPNRDEYNSDRKNNVQMRISGQCHGYAKMIQYYIGACGKCYGPDTGGEMPKPNDPLTDIQLDAIEKIRPGDLIRHTNSSGNVGHTIFVTSVYEDGSLGIAECNHSSANQKCLVEWIEKSATRNLEWLYGSHFGFVYKFKDDDWKYSETYGWQAN